MGYTIIPEDSGASAAPASASGYTVYPPQIDNPTDGMSAFDLAAAGAGKAVADAGLGVEQIAAWLGQNVPGLDHASAAQWAAQLSQEAAERRQQDAALMGTTAGKVGNFAGNSAMWVPAGMVAPEAALPRLLAAVGQGAAQGALAPTTDGDSRLLNMGVGAGLGAGFQYGANALGGLVKGATPASADVQAALDFANQNGGTLTRGQISGSGFTQRAERVLASLPGAQNFYRRAAAANTQAATNAVDRLTGGDAGALIQAAPQGATFYVDQPLLDAANAIPGQFSRLAGQASPSQALSTIRGFVGGDMVPNPVLAPFGANARAQAVAQGFPAMVPGPGGAATMALGDTLPMVGPRGDYGNYQAIRSTIGQLANSAGRNVDSDAYYAFQNALDDAAGRSLAAQGVDPAALTAARQAYAAQKIVQPARMVDTDGNVTYDPAKIATAIQTTDKKFPGRIDALGDAGVTLRQLASFGNVTQPVKSSGTAEGNLAGKFVTLDFLKDLLSGEGPGHAISGGVSLLAAPFGSNMLMQATRFGIPGLRSIPSSVTMPLGQLARAGLTGQLMGNGSTYLPLSP